MRIILEGDTPPQNRFLLVPTASTEIA